MPLDQQQMIVLKPNFFWDIAISVANDAATQNWPNCLWWSSDHRDHSSPIFFIQWRLWSQQVSEKSFQATEVSFVIVSTNPATWLCSQSNCNKLDLQQKIYHIFLTIFENNFVVTLSIFSFCENSRKSLIWKSYDC